MDPSNDADAVGTGEARRLLASALDVPDLASKIDEEVSFLDAGVNSGEMIRLLLEVEAYLDIEVDDDELFGITSLKELARFLNRHADSKNHVV